MQMKKEGTGKLKYIVLLILAVCSYQILQTMVGICIGIVYLYTRSMAFVFYMHILNNLLNTLPAPLSTESTAALLHIVSVIALLPALYFLYKTVDAYRVRAREEACLVENRAAESVG